MILNDGMQVLDLSCGLKGCALVRGEIKADAVYALSVVSSAVAPLERLDEKMYGVFFNQTYLLYYLSIAVNITSAHIIL